MGKKKKMTSVQNHLSLCLEQWRSRGLQKSLFFIWMPGIKRQSCFFLFWEQYIKFDIQSNDPVSPDEPQPILQKLLSSLQQPCNGEMSRNSSRTKLVSLEETAAIKQVIVSGVRQRFVSCDLDIKIVLLHKFFDNSKGVSSFWSLSVIRGISKIFSTQKLSETLGFLFEIWMKFFNAVVCWLLSAVKQL